MVGIGDMSGDVFGNGMLLSRHIQLVAAFDHRHIFLDPDPDPAASFAERERLFDLPRSSWADYDASADLGGRRRLPAQRQVDPALARGAARRSASTRRALTPAELINAILKAPVDLLYNGGIGTYVKATRQIARRGRRPRQRRDPRQRRASCAARWWARAATSASRSSGASSTRMRGRAHQHRRDRQLGRRRLLRPRGQHQDPARPRRSPTASSPRSSATRCSPR